MLTLPAIWTVMAMTFDARSHRIPNLLILSGIAAATLHFVLGGTGPTGEPWPRSCLLATGIALLSLSAYQRGILGAGDVKFLFVLALLGGVEGTGRALLLGGLLAGVWALASTIRSRMRPGTVPEPRSVDLPLAVPVGMGFLCALVSAGGTP